MSHLSLVTAATISAIALGALLFPAEGRGQEPGADGAELARRCAALNYLDLEQAGDAPARVVAAFPSNGRAATPQERTTFVKRGHSQGNPIPELDAYPDHCRVEGYVTPNVRFVLVLPPPDAWNTRFMLAACDAWCGKVHEEIVVPALYRGYATITNDGGHYSRAPFDGIWAHQNVPARIDFAHRANHVSAQVGKAIVQAYYDEQPSYSYIAGFSKGGNAGLFSAQLYPEDFDGIFVKAPVVRYNPKNAAHFPWIARAVYPVSDDAPVMYADKVPLIANAVVAACDAIDGLVDGVIDDPRRCHFDPSVLLCRDGQSEQANECLLQAQVDALRLIYRKPASGSGEAYFDYPVDPGSEGDWVRSLLPVRGSREPTHMLNGAATGLKYMAIRDNPGPGYDWRRFDYVASRAEIEDMSTILDPDSLDLRAFHARGGKMIVVHGWSDAMVSPSMTIDWFEDMQAFMGGAATTSDFVQLYVVPGMFHGSGGPGPYVFDAQSALVDWVENGRAPDHLILSDEPGAAASRTRPAFPYPATARYRGQGDPDRASSFERVE